MHCRGYRIRLNTRFQTLKPEILAPKSYALNPDHQSSNTYSVCWRAGGTSATWAIAPGGSLVVAATPQVSPPPLMSSLFSFACSLSPPPPLLLSLLIGAGFVPGRIRDLDVVVRNVGDCACGRPCREFGAAGLTSSPLSRPLFPSSSLSLYVHGWGLYPDAYETMVWL